MATQRPPQPAVAWREWWRRTSENAYFRVAVQVDRGMLVGAGMIVERSRTTMACQAGATAAGAPTDWPPPAPFSCLFLLCSVLLGRSSSCSSSGHRQSGMR